LRVVGRITEQNSRFFSGTGEILLPDGTVAVLARGKYMKVPLDKIADFNPDEFEWQVVQRGDDPEEFGV